MENERSIEARVSEHQLSREKMWACDREHKTNEYANKQNNSKKKQRLARR